MMPAGTPKTTSEGWGTTVNDPFKIRMIQIYARIMTTPCDGKTKP